MSFKSVPNINFMHNWSSIKPYLQVEGVPQGLRKPIGLSYSRWASHNPESKSRKFDYKSTSSFHGKSRFEMAKDKEHQKIPSIISQSILHQPKNAEVSDIHYK